MLGRSEPRGGIASFDRLVWQVMTKEPYASARRVFWIVDNGSAHRGQRSMVSSLYVSRRRGWPYSWPLVAAGLGIAYFALDDLLKFHEDLFPRVGVHENVVLGIYSVSVTFYVLRYRAFLREHEWPVLALALAAFAGSGVVDVADVYWRDGNYDLFVEEGLKLFGYALLACFLVGAGARMHRLAYSGDGAWPADVMTSAATPGQAAAADVDFTNEGASTLPDVAAPRLRSVDRSSRDGA